MIFTNTLNRTQAALFLQGLCPLCLDAQLIHQRDNLWSCPCCKEEFGLVDKDGDALAVAKVECWHCNHQWLGFFVAKAATFDLNSVKALNCPKCKLQMGVPTKT